MENRIVIALLEVNDEMAIAEDLGTIEYLEKEFSYMMEMNDNGINLVNARVLDADDKYDTKAIELTSQIFDEHEKPVATDDELIGILGQLLDDQEEDVEMSEKVRQGIYDVYKALCTRVNNW